MGVLTGKVVIVTGGGNGIGRECALLAGREGASVLVNDLGGGLKGEDAGSSGPAEEVAKEIRAAGGKAISNSDSVSDYHAVVGMIEQAKKEFGGLHGIINPAGILRDGMFHKMSVEDWRAVIDVHLHGAFNVTFPKINGRSDVKNKEIGQIVVGIVKIVDTVIEDRGEDRATGNPAQIFISMFRDDRKMTRFDRGMGLHLTCHISNPFTIVVFRKRYR